MRCCRSKFYTCRQIHGELGISCIRGKSCCLIKNIILIRRLWGIKRNVIIDGRNTWNNAKTSPSSRNRRWFRGAKDHMSTPSDTRYRMLVLVTVVFVSLHSSILLHIFATSHASCCLRVKVVAGRILACLLLASTRM